MVKYMEFGVSSFKSSFLKIKFLNSSKYKVWNGKFLKRHNFCCSQDISPLNVL